MNDYNDRLGHDRAIGWEYVVKNRICRSLVRHWEIFVCGILVFLFLLLHITSLRHKGLTTDESFHYQYGYRVLHGAIQRGGALDSSNAVLECACYHQ